MLLRICFHNRSFHIPLARFYLKVIKDHKHQSRTSDFAGISATKEDLNDMIAEADIDKSGTIEFDGRFTK